MMKLGSETRPILQSVPTNTPLRDSFQGEHGSEDLGLELKVLIPTWSQPHCFDIGLISHYFSELPLFPHL